MRNRDLMSLLLGLLAISLWCALSVGEENKKEEDTRLKKALNIFEIIRFDNTACNGNNNLNGTCYTAAECTERLGTAAGNCANGYGVCCTFSLSCGGMTSENCTYFTNPTAVTAGSCDLTVCPTSDNICQLRLDFQMFVIAGPSSNNAVVGEAVNGELVSVGGVQVTNEGRCLTDTFSVTNTRRPQICGTNTGQHMYVDASDDCNDLVFQLGADGIDTMIPTRNWNIKITQLSCDDKNLPPEGCTQYYSNVNGMGTIQTFNYAGGQQLANQDQTVCIRREDNMCRVCYFANLVTDVVVGGGTTVSATSKSNNAAVNICGAFTNPNQVPPPSTFPGVDFISIVGAETVNGAAKSPRICGGNGGLVTASGGVSKTICTNDAPFVVRFITDMFETAQEAKFNDQGAMISFVQDNMNC